MQHIFFQKQNLKLPWLTTCAKLLACNQSLFCSSLSKLHSLFVSMLSDSNCWAKRVVKSNKNKVILRRKRRNPGWFLDLHWTIARVIEDSSSCYNTNGRGI